RQQLKLLHDGPPARTSTEGDSDLRRLGTQASGPIGSISAAADELKEQAQRLGAPEVTKDLDRISSAAQTLHTMIADGINAPPAAPPTDTQAGQIAVSPARHGETGNILVVDDNAANRVLASRWQ